MSKKNGQDELTLPEIYSVENTEPARELYADFHSSFDESPTAVSPTANKYNTCFTYTDKNGRISDIN